jgi:hypothetical protein
MRACLSTASATTSTCCTACNAFLAEPGRIRSFWALDRPTHPPRPLRRHPRGVSRRGDDGGDAGRPPAAPSGPERRERRGLVREARIQIPSFTTLELGGAFLPRSLFARREASNTTTGARPARG